MRLRILIPLAGSLLLLAASGALAQDPNNAYIPDIQNGVYPVNTVVTIRGVVVTAIAPAGLWVQEPGAASFPRSGIWCYNGPTPQVQVGDKVRVRGRYEEYFDVSEVNIAAVSGSITLEGVLPVPQPALLDVNTIHTGSPTAEDWEGVLVKVDSVRVITRQSGGFGQYTVIEIDEDATAPDDTLTCDDNCVGAPPMPPVGAVFDFMTGVVHYSFGEHKLNPRDNDDLDWASGEPAPGVEIAYCTSNTAVDVRFDRDVDAASAGDELNYFFNNLGEFPAAAVRDAVEHDLVHLTVSTAFVPNNTVPEILDISGVKNEELVVMPGTVSKTFIGGVSTIDFVQTGAGGPSQVVNQVVTISGIVTGDNSHDYFGADGSRFYLEKPGGGPRSGIFVFDRLHLVTRGDQLTVAGTVLEFSRKTEIDDPVYVRVMATGQPIPGPDVVTVAALEDTLTAEAYEGVFVRVNNVVVAADTSIGFGEWKVKAAATPDTVLIGDEGLYFYDPTVGDPLAFVQGPLDFAFGTFRIQPRSPFDIASNGVAVEETGAPEAARTELHGNAPNPFNPATTIRFALRHAGPVDLAIYDLSGRLVRSLSRGDRLAAGEHTMTWDGRSDAGKDLPSGVYLVRFESGDVESAHKITLMK